MTRTIVATDREDFQKEILKIISTGEYKQILEHMSYSTDEFEQGFIQGLYWATLYSINCKTYTYIEENIDEDKVSE